eukprot:Tbor_TRINITY_DN3446_c0_g1::TRINITY_DN3446_c0_g1_i1::g.3789::m.3789/K17616/CTDSPL2; CTD small phosphatase-like protein 2
MPKKDPKKYDLRGSKHIGSGLSTSMERRSIRALSRETRRCKEPIFAQSLQSQSISVTYMMHAAVISATKPQSSYSTEYEDALNEFDALEVSLLHPSMAGVEVDEDVPTEAYISHDHCSRAAESIFSEMLDQYTQGSASDEELAQRMENFESFCSSRSPVFGISEATCSSEIHPSVLPSYSLDSVARGILETHDDFRDMNREIDCIHLVRRKRTREKKNRKPISKITSFYCSLQDITHLSRPSRTKLSRTEAKRSRSETPKAAHDAVVRKRVRSKNKGNHELQETTDGKVFLIPLFLKSTFSLSVVLDLDETLVYARSGPIMVRPYFSYLLRTLQMTNCEIILWTAGISQYVDAVVHALTVAAGDCAGPMMGGTWYHHIITRDSRWFEETSPGVKDLRMLGRPLGRVVILENNPCSVQLQTDNGILVQDYLEENFSDQSLKEATDIIRTCAESDDPVPTTLANEPAVEYLEFSLAAEHCCSNKPSKVRAYGVRYIPRKGRKRTYAGESPIN